MESSGPIHPLILIMMTPIGARVGLWLDEVPPDDPTHFGKGVPAYIEAVPEGHRLSGGEAFDFFVCTPSWVAEQSITGEPRFGRYVLVERWDWEAIKAAIDQLCESVKGPDWPTVALKLAAYGSWEFEGYFDPANPETAGADGPSS
jgi:hypothetical protein